MIRKLKLFFGILHYRKLLVGVFIISLLTAIMENVGFSLVLPILELILGNDNDTLFSFVIRPMIDSFGQQSVLVGLIGVFAFMMVNKSLLQLAQVYFSNLLVLKFRHRLRTQIFNRYQGASVNYLNQFGQGEIFHNVMSEPEKSSALVRQFIEFVVQFINFVVIYSILLATSFETTIALSVLVGLVAGVTTTIGNRQMRDVSVKSIELGQKISNTVNESVALNKQIKLSNIQAQNSQDFRENSKDNAYLLVLRYVYHAYPKSLTEMSVILAFAAGLAYMATRTDINIADYVSTIALFAVIAPKLVLAVNGVVNNRLALETSIPSMKLMKNLLEWEIKQERFSLDDAEELDSVNTDIEFVNIDFEYDESNPVFNKLNLRVPHKKMTALVGPSGVGKTTLVDLLLGFYVPSSGEIRINGDNYRRFTAESLRAEIGYVSQDIALFNRSIAENISLSEEVDTQRLFQVVEMAGCQFVHDLKNGIETVVGDRGVLLSGGQKQRISIARVLYQDPDVLVFDEATSALDNETEKLIQQNIERLAGEKTIIVIAHRLSTIENADVVYDLGKMRDIQV